ncbi:Nascent polypeptide-associated complex subunit beta [Mycena venus]|uniref:Nascent polypeptide-associated complex subunit beta n=1 Tax=Mycena venus TaxID=2733690 RepID=A0A8H6YK37_9AGAR|nr:Nascent polypeptide-associated complex subunit beta [Mycena venus]
MPPQFDPAKLAKLQAQSAAARIGGKGTVRRKVVRKPKASTVQDDKKLQGALKKLNVQPIPGVEEVNMFREDGNVLHFTAPKGECGRLPRLSAIAIRIWLPKEPVVLMLVCDLAVHAALSANTFAIYGTGHVKELTELVPGILNQLGPDSLASLRKLAESYQAIQGQGQGQRPGGAAADDDDDDDVPDLVENFDVEADAAKASLD